jgi:23S rRNA pseudouridine2604 synthase
MEFPMRLNKYLAHQGLASRREADTLIVAGKVTINGKKATLGQQVNERDDVKVTGKTKEKTYLAYYKGRGIITHSPEAGETDIKTRIAKDYKLTDIYPLGRLDKDSEGLIILTNDGRLTGPLLDPERGNEKEYEVTVDKAINGWFLKHMAEGVKIERYTTKPAVVTPVGTAKLKFRITLTEGKKHQIRRMCAALGYQVMNLRRVRIMNIEVGKLKPNQYRKLTEVEVLTLLRTLGVS